MTVSATGAELRLVQEVSVYDPRSNPDGSHGEYQMRQEDRDLVSPCQIEASIVGGFDEWKQVRREAHSLIDNWLAETRRVWHRPGSGFPYKNPSAMGKLEERVALLYRHLTENEQVDHSGRPSIKRLADLIGVDFPRAQKQSA
jgi:hypothetical protein